jgi:predicted nucleic acid-binding protein
LIGLHSIGRLDLLRDLFNRILVPPGVAQEVQSVASPQWVTVVSPQKPVLNTISQLALGLGETEALSLALEINAERIILDDGAARSLATAHGLNVIGVLGVLLIAKNLALIPSLRNEIDALRIRSFRLSPQVYRDVLSRAGEL